MKDIHDPLDAAVVLKVAVHKLPGGERGWWRCDTDTIHVNPASPYALWSVGHEVGHATGAANRLNRRAMQFYYREMNKTIFAYLFQKYLNRTCVRAEEAICDLVAYTLTGKTRVDAVGHRSGYGQVTPGTRTDRYVQYHAQKAIEYITAQVQQEAA